MPLDLPNLTAGAVVSVPIGYLVARLSARKDARQPAPQLGQVHVLNVLVHQVTVRQGPARTVGDGNGMWQLVVAGVAAVVLAYLAIRHQVAVEVALTVLLGLASGVLIAQNVGARGVGRPLAPRFLLGQVVLLLAGLAAVLLVFHPVFSATDYRAADAFVRAGRGYLMLSPVSERAVVYQFLGLALVTAHASYITLMSACYTLALNAELGGRSNSGRAFRTLTNLVRPRRAVVVIQGVLAGVMLAVASGLPLHGTGS